MSLKVKLIAFSSVALIAAVAGIYAFAPDSQNGIAPNPESAAVQAEQSEQPAQKAVDKDASAQAPKASAAPDPQTTTKPSAAVAPPQTSRKLTREQLMPPPMTEGEKLQKAAEQESNF
jgi:hypothetical protein